MPLSLIMPNCHVFNFLSLIVLRHFHLWSLPRISNHLEKQMTIHVKNSAYPPFQQSLLPINLLMRLIWFSSTGLPGLPGWLSLRLQDSQAVQCNPDIFLAKAREMARVFAGWKWAIMGTPRMKNDGWKTTFLLGRPIYFGKAYGTAIIQSGQQNTHPKISSPHHQHDHKKYWPYSSWSHSHNHGYTRRIIKK